MIHIFSLNIFSRLFGSIIAVSFYHSLIWVFPINCLTVLKLCMVPTRNFRPLVSLINMESGRALPAVFFIRRKYHSNRKQPLRPNLPDITLPLRNDERWKKANLWDSDNQSQSFSPPLMGGVRGGWRKQLILMVSSTPSKFCKTSLFQNRKTLNPWLWSHASRRISLSFSSSAC